MTAVPLRLVGDDGRNHDVIRLQAEVAKLKRLWQASEEERLAEKDARMKYHAENKRLKASLSRQDSEQAEDELVQAVFTFWQLMCRPKAKLGSGRTKAVQARLRDKPPTTPVEFFKAVLGAAWDPYTRSKDDGGVTIYNDLELICRNEVKLADFIDRGQAIPDVRAFIVESAGDEGVAAARALMELERRANPRFAKEAA
jgi:hypothetical protein